MELFLNLAWVLVSVAALVGWIYCRRGGDRLRPRTRHGKFLLELEALICALIILFFSISMTDDLHPEIFGIVEEGSNSRRALAGGNHQTASLNSHHFATPPANVVLSDMLSSQCVALCWISPNEIRPPASIVVPTSEGRAPPHTLILS